jgi:hypothetical protein
MGIRTPDLILTMDALYQLSYRGATHNASIAPDDHPISGKFARLAAAMAAIGGTSRTDSFQAHST